VDSCFSGERLSGRAFAARSSPAQTKLIILGASFKAILLNRIFRENKNGHCRMQIWPWPSEKNLETLFYAISLHAPIRKNDSNTKCCGRVASGVGACSSKKSSSQIPKQDKQNQVWRQIQFVNSMKRKNAQRFPLLESVSNPFQPVWNRWLRTARTEL